MRVIVVDDEKLALESMRVKLTHIERISEVHAFSTPEAALEHFAENGADIAFLDIQMPRISGLVLAARLREIKPNVIIIFITGYAEYALDALKLHADGYLMKPMSEADIERELDDVARRHLPIEAPKRVRIQCFGKFEVFVDDKPLLFTRQKSKELLAFLVDRRGASSTMAEIAEALWEDGEYGISRNNQIHSYLSELSKTLASADAADIILRQRNSLAIDKTKLDCDYYRCLDGDPAAVNSYTGEYMSQYAWAEFTTGALTSKYN